MNWLESAGPIFAFIGLVIVLHGLYVGRLSPTGVVLLRRMSACFTTIILLGITRMVLLMAFGNGQIVEIGDLALSFVSTFVLFLGGLEVINQKDLSPDVRRIVGASVPPALFQNLPHAQLPAAVDGLAQVIKIVEVIDSSTSCASSVFFGLAIAARLFAAGRTWLGAAVAAAFLGWSMPELFYHSGEFLPRLILLASGLAAAWTAVLAARRI